ncbi:hypothetical protein [Clostridium perfringens]|uniref:TRASH domain-containing protein n=1 Tax=Clostridium perfringens TaxID=1502 RepID=A0A140GR64_CLOPF|nr:hypothetical protein [Clostridium perfringens]AMN31023.1 hypothetical protein JFP838_pA0107 [Clostridium perfringens]
MGIFKKKQRCHICNKKTKNKEKIVYGDKSFCGIDCYLEFLDSLGNEEKISALNKKKI